MRSEREEVEESRATSRCVFPFVAGFSATPTDPTLVYSIGMFGPCNRVSASSSRVASLAFLLKSSPPRHP